MDSSIMQQAREIMGDAHHRSDEPVEAVEELQVEEPVQAEEPEVEQEEAQGEDQGEELVEGQDEEPGDGPDIRTIAELAKAIDVDPEFLYGIEIGMPESMESKTVSQLKNEYIDMSREREQMQSKMQELESKASGYNQEASASITEEMKKAEAQIGAIELMYNAVDWAELENSDPANAVLLKNKYQERFAQANQMLNQATQQRDQMRHQQFQQAASVMLDMVPEWRDQKIMDEDRSKMYKVFRENQFNDNEIMAIADPRVMKIMRDYTKLLELSKAGQEAVSKGPKVKPLQSGARVRRAKKAIDTGKIRREISQAPPGQRRKLETQRAMEIFAASKK